MTFLLISLLSVLAALTAWLLAASYPAGIIVGANVLVPFLFIASLLFARLIDLDGRIKRREKQDQTEQRESLEQ